MGFDIASYIMGEDAEKAKGAIVIEGNLVAVDDGEGNITLTEETNG